MAEAPEFVYGEWASSCRLSSKTLAALEGLDCVDAEDWCRLRDEDIAALDITVGQRNRLRAGLADLNAIYHPVDAAPDPQLHTRTRECRRSGAGGTGGGDGGGQPGPPAPGEQAELARRANILQKAGENFDHLLGLWGPEAGGNKARISRETSNVPVLAPTHESSGFDPTSRSREFLQISNNLSNLFLKSDTVKTIHITDHIPEEVKIRLRRRRAERSTVGTTTDGNLVLRKADEQISYLGIHQHEWSAASIRVLFALIKEGQLTVDQIPNYLSYIVMIMEFVPIFEWNSILSFDVRYRENQARTGGEWGTPCEVIRAQTLRTKQVQYEVRDNRGPTNNIRREPVKSGYVSRSGVYTRPQFPNRDSNQTATQVPEMCRQWALGRCAFGDKCKYVHSSEASKN